MVISASKTNNIISASVTNDTLHEVKELLKNGFSGRSEIIRAGVHLLYQERKERERMQQKADAILILQYDEKHGTIVQQLQHKYSAIVKTKLHNHLEDHTCMEILTLQGSGVHIRELTDKSQSSKGIVLAKLVVL